METPHDRWVASGKCPVISVTKAWCNRPVGHSGPHGSQRVPYPDQAIGKDNPAWVDWER